MQYMPLTKSNMKREQEVFTKITDNPNAKPKKVNDEFKNWQRNQEVYNHDYDYKLRASEKKFINNKTNSNKENHNLSVKKLLKYRSLI